MPISTSWYDSLGSSCKVCNILAKIPQCCVKPHLFYLHKTALFTATHFGACLLKIYATAHPTPLFRGGVDKCCLGRQTAWMRVSGHGRSMSNMISYFVRKGFIIEYYYYLITHLIVGLYACMHISIYWSHNENMLCTNFVLCQN